MASELDRINRGVWRSDRLLDLFARRRGWMDPGEERVMQRVAEEARDQPILDIGIGAGRTVPYLRSLSRDYVGVDYLEEMVRLARSRYPEARIEHADARDLSGFADAAFGLVMFSFNGIDGVAHEDRAKVLGEVRRVLRPGGLFAYSTHNLGYRHAARPPWHPSWYRTRSPRHLIRLAARTPRHIRTYRRLRTLNARGDGWAILVNPSYGFSVVFHYVTLDEALRELRASGFTAAVEVYDTAGARVEAEDDTSESSWLHLVARKP